MPLDVTARTFRVNDAAKPDYDWSAVLVLPRPPFSPCVCNRLLADYISDWLATNQIKEVVGIYHNPYPVGFVCRWIERAEEAEARVRELERNTSQ